MDEVKAQVIELFMAAGLTVEPGTPRPDTKWSVKVEVPDPALGFCEIVVRSLLDWDDVDYFLDESRMPIHDFEGFKKVFEVFVSSAAQRRAAVGGELPDE